MMQRVFGSVCFGVVTALAVVGCAAEVDEGTGTSEEALKGTNACALVRCASGTHCEVQKRRAVCVADPGCVTDADCRLFSDYCTGCDCRALTQSAPDPTCAGPGVRCFADPCGNKVAACVAGACVIR
ncbi:MAG: hypothetical protein IPF92_18815 [Myxococcales bacterium]|jgi:hypothetical protein|nr:hypothetical protein [Myxococcales bacterium]MBL0194231.1 hypothetical protein [Myxococcales bacterium]HQY62385.1 hypothetical protein [Polyangiaceae bacterium]